MTYHPRVTPSRLAWLQLLEREYAAVWRGGPGQTRFACMQLGWTEWARLIPGPPYERLTDEGRRVLLAERQKSLQDA